MFWRENENDKQLIYPKCFPNGLRLFLLIFVIWIYSKEKSKKTNIQIFYSAFARVKPTHSEAGKTEHLNNLKTI